MPWILITIIVAALSIYYSLYIKNVFLKRELQNSQERLVAAESRMTNLVINIATEESWYDE